MLGILGLGKQKKKEESFRLPASQVVEVLKPLFSIKDGFYDFLVQDNSLIDIEILKSSSIEELLQSQRRYMKTEFVALESSYTSQKKRRSKTTDDYDTEKDFMSKRKSFHSMFSSMLTESLAQDRALVKNALEQQSSSSSSSTSSSNKTSMSSAHPPLQLLVHKTVSSEDYCCTEVVSPSSLDLSSSEISSSINSSREPHHHHVENSPVAEEEKDDEKIVGVVEQLTRTASESTIESSCTSPDKLSTNSSTSTPSSAEQRRRRNSIINLLTRKVSLGSVISTVTSAPEAESPLVMTSVTIGSTPSSLNYLLESPRTSTELVYKYIREDNLHEFMKVIEMYSAPGSGETMDTLFRDTNGGATLLHKAAKYQKTAIISYLLQKGASVGVLDDMEATPLMYAVISGSAKACGILLANGAVVNVRDRYEMTPLLLALKCNHLDIISTLLVFGADINFKGPIGNTALHISCKEGDLSKVKFLVENNASIHRTNRRKETCLFHALAHPDVLFFILDYASSREGPKFLKFVSQSDEFKRTVIHHCALNGYTKSLLMIMSKIDDMQIGPLLNLADEKGFTALHTAVDTHQFDIVKVLTLCSQTNTDAQHLLGGNTALHMALQHKRMCCVELLYNYGEASAKIKNAVGKTAKAIAKENKINLKLIKKSRLSTSSAVFMERKPSGNTSPASPGKKRFAPLVTLFKVLVDTCPPSTHTPAKRKSVTYKSASAKVLTAKRKSIVADMAMGLRELGKKMSAGAL